MAVVKDGDIRAGILPPAFPLYIKIFLIVSTLFIIQPTANHLSELKNNHMIFNAYAIIRYISTIEFALLKTPLLLTYKATCRSTTISILYCRILYLIVSRQILLNSEVGLFVRTQRSEYNH